MEMDLPVMVDVTLDLEVVLRNHEESRRLKMTVPVPEDVEDIEDLMHCATHLVLVDLDTVGQNRMVLEDDRHNIYILLISEIQAINIYPPDKLPLGLGVSNEE